LTASRSLGPALLVGGKALQQVWLSLVAPSIAEMVGGVLFRAKVLKE
jgi:aquaporin Z